MTKQEFLDALRAKLSRLPKQEVEEQLNFYAEMIEDRVEEGITEDEAVTQVGSVDEIASQIVSTIPLSKIAKEKLKPKRKLSGLEIALLIVSAPIWLPIVIVLVATVFAVVVPLYVSFWAIVVSLWAVFAAAAISAPSCIVSGIIYICIGHPASGLAAFGVAIICAALAIFLFFACKAASKLAIVLLKKISSAIKKRFVNKEEAK